MPNIQMVDLRTQYQHIKNQIDIAIQEVLDESAFIGGRQIAAFSQSLENYLQVKHVIPCGATMSFKPFFIPCKVS